ncbi:SDR family oxidoreductase [Rhodobacteraceae bacterium KMM 6894]|nr:SDR family oxidoreductase [Rhodobacteraceae bacterium KMM 6894]
MMDLTGKVAVVTGASSGLGAHFAQVLGRAGAHVCLLARSEDKLTKTANALTALDISADCYAGDVTDRASLEATFAAIAKAHGGTDILINNAGIARTAPYLEMEDADWSAVLDTDLSGVWRCGQIAARQMVQRGKGGSIINIASILGQVVQPTQTNYAAVKAGVLHLTKAMARDLGRYNIRVNAIAPGYFQTEINADFFASDAGEKLIQKLFPRRLGELSELDGPLLLLASDAGSFMNGTTLTVDGGATLAGL